MSAIATRARPARQTARPRRLGRGWRNATLVVHIVAAGAWIGIDVWPMLTAGLLTGGADPATVSRLFFPPAVSLTTLNLATVLAVFKPWGRIRARRAREDTPPPPRTYRRPTNDTSSTRRESAHVPC